MCEHDDYQQELKNLIENPKSGIILDADEEYSRRNSGYDGDRAAFKLQGGQVVKKFLTIWELFDESEAFEKCIGKLVEKAETIRNQFYYSYIVTTTAAAEELGNHIFDRLKQNIGSEKGLLIYHYSDYPNTPLPNEEIEQLEGETVLLLTDVVTTGNLIRNMIEIIEKKGGKLVAILAIVITDKQFIESKFNKYQRERFYYLTYCPIRFLTENEYDQDKLISIDYASVLPEHINHNHYEYCRPAFSLKEAFNQLEEAKAIDFDFYIFEDRYCTYAFIISRLLNHDKIKFQIWQKIWQNLQHSLSFFINNSNSSLILVTTYKKQDLDFKEFVRKQLNELKIATDTVVTLKRSIKDIPSRNITLGRKSQTLQDKEVLVTLATLSTTEKLRSLVSLLVSYGVQKITVVCLINEMGPCTTNFINAIKNLTQRITTTDNNDSFTEFNFYMIYDFLDIGHHDINRMYQEVDWLFSRYNHKTKVPSFRRLSKRIKGYFNAQNYISRAYRNETNSTDFYYSSISPYQLKQDSSNKFLVNSELNRMSVTSQETKIALMTYNLSLYRDFEPIIKEIARADKRRTFFHLYGLILSDVHYLQFTKNLDKLKEVVEEKIKEIWQEFFSLEANANHKTYKNNLNSLLNCLVYLIFCLGLVSYYSNGKNTIKETLSVTNLLFAEKTPEEWINRYPNLSLIYFYDERLFYTISFLLYGLFPKLTVSNPEITLLEGQIKSFQTLFRDNINEQESDEIKSKSQNILNNFDTILTEIGKHHRVEKHQTIRYLQREVLRPRQRHNPIFTSLNTLKNELEEFFKDDRNRSDSVDRPFDISQSVVLDKVDEALNSSSSLYTIVEASQQLFYFTPSVGIDRTRYINSTNQNNSFARDCQQLINLLQDNIRDSKTVSYKNYVCLQEYYATISDDFYNSSLRETLISYIVSLNEIVEKCLSDANIRLNQEKGFENLLKNVYLDWKNSQNHHLDSYWVLSEKYLLQETLRNIFFNLHYAFANSLNKKSLPPNSVAINLKLDSFQVKPDNQTQESIFFELIVRGGDPPNTDDLDNSKHTIADQLFKLGEFGAQYEIEKDKRLNSYIFRIKFISRIRFNEVIKGNNN